MVGVKELQTNKPGVRVLVDDDVAELLKYAHITVRWSSTTKAYYAFVRTTAGTKRLSRLVIDVPDGMQVDHINRNTLDERRANLRAATRAQNLRNRRDWSATGYKGVRYRKARPGKGREHYEAWINVDKQRIYLDRSKTPEGAARLYDAAAREYFGEFALPNFRDGDEASAA
jgi:hypothetical protein